MSDMDFVHLLEPYKGEIASIADDLERGDLRKGAATLGTIATAIATGHPELAILAPFASRMVSGAFSSAANKRLDEAIRQHAKDLERNELVTQMTLAVEALMCDFLVQLVRSQANLNEETVKMLSSQLERPHANHSFTDAIQSIPIEHVAAIVRQLNVRRGTGVRVSENGKRCVLIDVLDVDGGDGIVA